MVRLVSLCVATGLMAFATAPISAQGHCHYGGGYYGGGGYNVSRVAVGMNFGNPYAGYGFAQPGFGYGHNMYRPVYAAPIAPIYNYGCNGGWGGYGGYGHGQPFYPGYGRGCGGFGGSSIFIGF